MVRQTQNHPDRHDHSHDHSHDGHGHHAYPLPAQIDRAFILGIVLNLGFVLLEFAGGLWANSMALLADAGHNLSDVLSLLLAWGASRLVHKAATRQFSYGFKSATIQAALLNALLLLPVAGVLLFESLSRLGSSPEVSTPWVIALALLGMLVNAFTAWRLHAGHQQDLNLAGAYWHMLLDALVSLAVVVAGVLMAWTDWFWLDPLLSLGVVAIIFHTGWQLLRGALRLSLHGVPESIDWQRLESWLLDWSGVMALHELHVWALSTTETALTVHLQVDAQNPPQLSELLAGLSQQFGIEHACIQFELESCAQKGCGLGQPSAKPD